MCIKTNGEPFNPSKNKLIYQQIYVENIHLARKAQWQKWWPFNTKHPTFQHPNKTPPTKKPDYLWINGSLTEQSDLSKPEVLRVIAFSHPTSPTPALLWISARRRKKKVAIITCAKQTRQINSLKSKKPDLGRHGKIEKQPWIFTRLGGMAWHDVVLFSHVFFGEVRKGVWKIYSPMKKGMNRTHRTITFVVIILNDPYYHTLYTGWWCHVRLGFPSCGLQESLLYTSRTRKELKFFLHRWSKNKHRFFGVQWFLALQGTSKDKNTPREWEEKKMSEKSSPTLPNPPRVHLLLPSSKNNVENSATKKHIWNLVGWAMNISKSDISFRGLTSNPRSPR